MMLNSETVFHDNPYAGPSTSLLSDEEEDVTTSPSLTFGNYIFFSELICQPPVEAAKAITFQSYF